ncbi:3-phosphoshikimate 1-carboxyvinyltransferase [Streptomyces asiaticus]|uniref:3-phosphoshikimate 1-carboxyvinyltransferase n=1 Tax=Streptomyces asiaticus TaxID=114695 RepID=UPI003F674B19
MTTIRVSPPSSGVSGEVRVPTSKPHTQRAILLGLLANAPSSIVDPAWSSESRNLLGAATELGLEVLEEDDQCLVVIGTGRSLTVGSADRPLSADGSGFNFRTLAAVACLRRGTTVLEGNASMLARPVLEHLRFAADLGARIEDLSDSRHLRIRVTGSRRLGGDTEVDNRHSSQVLTAVLLVAPMADRPVRVRCPQDGTVGEGYVDLTVEMMRAHRVEVERDGSRFVVQPGSYQSQIYRVASDFTALSYLAGAVAAGGGGSVVVRDYSPSSLSSEAEFLEVLRHLGISAVRDPLAGTLRLERGTPAGPRIEIDSRNIPTVVPTLAAIAPYVDAEVVVRNAAHVNNHKCRRLDVMISELFRLGCDISPTFDSRGLVDGFSTPGPRKPTGGGLLSSHGDHRIFMSLTTAALGARHRTAVEGAQHLPASFPGYLQALADMGVYWEHSSPDSDSECDRRLGRRSGTEGQPTATA